MGKFCKPFSPEKQAELTALNKRIRQERIDAFNKKYTDKGKPVPPYELIFRRDYTTRIYPDGRMEFMYSHPIRYIIT